MPESTAPDLVEEVEELLAKVPAWKFTAQDWGNEIRVGYHEGGQRFTVAKVQTFEGPAIDRPLAQLFARAPDLLRRLVEEVKRLHRPIPAATTRCVRCGRDVGRLCNKCAKEPSSVF